MAGLQQLKKRLRSVNTTSQIAAAMKTVSSAKFSRLSAKNREYKEYAESLRSIFASCPAEFEADTAVQCRTAPPCYILLGSNRGLCGSYNIELNSFAEKILKEEKDSYVIVCGKAAANYFKDKKILFNSSLVFPDVPSFEDYKKLFSEVKSKYLSGEISSVNMIYSEFVNTLVQTPSVRRILPFSRPESRRASSDSFIFEPDKETVFRALLEKLIDCDLYACVLEAATGCQAATLMAMRTAADNASQAAFNLTSQINKKRQSEVTAGVIETTSDMLRGEEE